MVTNSNITSIVSFDSVEDKYNHRGSTLNYLYYIINHAENKLYYSPDFEETNNITGTGYKLRDIAYRATCSVLNCASGCCVNNLNNIQCGIKSKCERFQNHVDFWNIATPIFISMGVGVVIFIFGILCGFFLSDDCTLSCK